ncbi:MAG: type III-B CRISPR module-associated protein Cmr5 [Anaerolineales bacterium]|nr:type III-B CRISPR module-associated protein Cmr5 [Anaerolineales bacterium]
MTTQQQLAKNAHENILKVTDSEKKKYGTMAHKLPILIRTAGLAQALAFVQARGSEAQHKLLDHLAQTINIQGISDKDGLTKASREAALSQYIFLTRRVMDALVWYKRFTESILRVTARDADDEVDQLEAESTAETVGG